MTAIRIKDEKMTVWFHSKPKSWSDEGMIVTCERVRKYHHKKYPNYRIRDCEKLTWTIYKKQKQMRKDGWKYIGRV